MVQRNRLLRAAALGCLVLMGCASGGDGGDTSTSIGTTTPIPSPRPHPLPSDTPAAEPNPAERTPIPTRAELRRDMRRLWTDHVAYTRFYLIESIAGLPGAAKTAYRLLQNQIDIGNALKPFFGEALGDELTRLLQAHI